MHLFVIYTYLFIGQIETSELHSGPSSTDFTINPFCFILTEASAVWGNREKREIESQGLPGELGH